MARTDTIENLIDKVAAGNRRAFAQLYAVTCDRMNALVCAIVQDAEGAEAALVAAYGQVWRKAGAFRSTDLSGLTWLTVQARGVALASGAGADVPEIDEASLGHASIGAVLAGLAPLDAEAVKAAYFCGDGSRDEIAGSIAKLKAGLLS